MSITNYGDVHNFHRKFGLPHPRIPQLLDDDTFDFRLNFMKEELEELESAHDRGDLAGFFDALLDLTYVVMGTGVMAGLPWQAGWDVVQYANMRKVRAESAQDDRSSRKHRLDVVKPPGWEPPNIKAVIDRYTDLAMRTDTDPVSGPSAMEEAKADYPLIGDPNDR